MESKFHKFCYDIAYVFALVAYCVIVPLFILVATFLYAIWWVYEPLVKMLRGTDAKKTQDK